MRGGKWDLAVDVEDEGWAGGLTLDVQGEGRREDQVVDVDAEVAGRGITYGCVG